MPRRKKEPVTANAVEAETSVVETTVSQPEDTTEEQATTEKTEPELTLGDLTMLRNIVDLASSRGAFRGNELEVIGKAFNKLNTFLNAVAPKTEESEKEEDSESTGSTATS